MPNTNIVTFINHPLDWEALHTRMPMVLIKEMERYDQFSYAMLLRAWPEINDEMIHSCAEGIPVERLKAKKHLSQVADLVLEILRTAVSACRKTIIQEIG